MRVLMVLVAGLLWSACAFGQVVVVTTDRKDRVYLKDDQTVEGTVLSEGPLGLTMAVDDQERFIPAERLARGENGAFRIERGEGKPVSFKVIETQGQLVVQGRLKQEETAAAGEEAAGPLAEMVTDEQGEDQPKPRYFASGRPVNAKKKPKPPRMRRFFSSGAPPVKQEKKGDKKEEPGAPRAPQQGAGRGQDPTRMLRQLLGGGGLDRDAILELARRGRRR